MIIPEKNGTGCGMPVYTITEHFFLSIGKCMKLSKHLGGASLAEDVTTFVFSRYG